MSPVLPWRIGDRARLRKAHPCGGDLWRVVRTGADMGLVCETCGRRVLLPRDQFDRQLRERVPAVLTTEATERTEARESTKGTKGHEESRE